MELLCLLGKMQEARKIRKGEKERSIERSYASVSLKKFRLRSSLELEFYFSSYIAGLTSADEIEPTPFKIEWIPDVLPLSHIGELRIQFEFGHLPHPKTS